MSDAAIFIIGSGVFAITTTATLLYGYRWFTYKAIEDGVDVGEGWDEAKAAPTGDASAPVSDDRVIPIETARSVRPVRSVPLT
jgi:hypothetical protein